MARGVLISQAMPSRWYACRFVFEFFSEFMIHNPSADLVTGCRDNDN
jgi:hypothetical protein